MSTVTYILSNNEEISFTWDGLNAFDFLNKVCDEGEALDCGLLPELEVVSIRIKYDFPVTTYKLLKTSEDSNHDQS